MPSSRQSASSIYAQQMLSFGYGSALWEPPPLYNYERINIGDVGYISDGSFHLLFSAATPVGDRRLGEDVPDSFEPLEVGPVVRYQPRVPGYLCTKTVRVRGADIGASVSSTAISPGVHLAFELTDNQGAILVTKYPTYREDAERKSRFKKYIKRHYDSWVTFARYHDHDDSIQPILVTGMDLTLDFAMLAYSNNTGRLVTEFKAGAPLITSASASVWGSWNSEGLVHHNCGPQVCAPPPTSDPEISHHSTAPDGNSNTYNQCIFLRYYSLRKRAGLFPNVIKAGAGSHNLDPDSSSDSEFAVKLTDGDPMEEDAVYQNTPRPVDALDCVAEYIFQNSSATAVLVHHDDIASFLGASGNSFLIAVTIFKYAMKDFDVTDMEYIRFKTTAQIFVESDGDGQILNPPSSSSTFSPTSNKNSKNSAVLGYNSEGRVRSTRNDPIWPPRPLIQIPGIFGTTSELDINNQDGIDIPQRSYIAKNNQRYDDVILFSAAGKLGFSASCALDRIYTRLYGRDDHVFVDGDGASCSIRLEWPGYSSFSCRIKTVDWCRPLTRAKLATELAKLLARFIKVDSETELDPAYSVWRVGSSNGIQLKDLVLTSMKRVSKASWQPHFRLTPEATMRLRNLSLIHTNPPQSSSQSWLDSPKFPTSHFQAENFQDQPINRPLNRPDNYVELAIASTPSVLLLNNALQRSYSDAAPIFTSPLQTSSPVKSPSSRKEPDRENLTLV